MKKHKSQLFIYLGLVVLASSLGGCSSADRLPCPAPGEEAAYTIPGEKLVALTIRNDTCMSICVLLVSPDHCEYMGGENWVEDHPLHSREAITMYVPPSRYAIWVELCTEEFRADEHLTVDAEYEHSIIDPASGNTPPCDTSLTIVNNTAVPICNLRIGNSESVYTGWNWVGTEHIQPGESLDLTLRPDTYFIRAEACDGTWLRSEVDVSISDHQTWTVP